MPTAGSVFRLPDFGGTVQPPARARLSGVTRKVSSYSIHTLLCSGEHKNPSEDGLREEPIRPQHKAAWCALSLGCKCRGFGSRISEAENAKRCQTSATSCHLRRKRYKQHFFLVYLQHKPTSVGRTGGWLAGISVGCKQPTHEYTDGTIYIRRYCGR